MDWTNQSLPEISIDDKGLGGYVIKIKNLADKRIIELNKKVLDLRKTKNEYTVVVESDYASRNILTLTVNNPTEELLTELKFVLEVFFKEQIKFVQRERESYFQRTSFLFKNEEVYIPPKENPNVVYLPLDCPACGRRRLLFDRFNVRINCEKCGRDGTELDQLTAKRKGE